MRLPRRWWRPRNLLLAWCAYWVALIVITVGPAIEAAWHMSHQPHSHGSVNVSFGNGGFTANILERARTTWTGGVSLLTLALLVAVPPLLLWLVWFVGTSRTNNAELSAAKRDARREELYATDSRTEITESSPSRRHAREEF